MIYRGNIEHKLTEPNYNLFQGSVTFTWLVLIKSYRTRATDSIQTDVNRVVAFTFCFTSCGFQVLKLSYLIYQFANLETERLHVVP